MASDRARTEGHDEAPAADTIEMPAATVWPMVLGLGVALLAVGFITDLVFSALGALLFVIAVAGWVRALAPEVGEFREELPPEHARPLRPAAREVQALRAGMPGHRLQIPEKVHPYSAGAKGGIVGGAAMAVLALAYGLISGHGIWYPVNLLAATVVPDFGQTVADLERFSWLGLIVGLVIHAVGSVGNGLLAGVLLPMLPGRPLIWAGVVAPLLWTGAVYGFIGVLNPLLEKYVDWPWFIASQFAYGLAVGAVVQRSEKVPAAPQGHKPPEVTHPDHGPPHRPAEGQP